MFEYQNVHPFLRIVIEVIAEKEEEERRIMIEVRAERVSSKNLIILITKLPLVIVDGNDNPIWKILH